jgi:peroxiredoxin
MEKNDAMENNWVDEKLATLRGEEEWQPDVRAALGRFMQRRANRTWMWRRWAMAGTVATAAFLFAMVLPSPRVLAHRCLECSVAVWQSLSGQSDVTSNLAGQTAPDFALQDANGKEVRLSELKGKVVLVNFWATWCGGCQVEIPWFVEFEKKYADRGLTVIGVSMDSDGWKEVRPWIKEKGVNYTVVIGSEELAKKYGLDGMPLTALVGRDGKIVDTHAGVVDREGTEKKIRELLEKRVEE